MAQEQMTVPLVSNRPTGPRRQYLSDDDILNGYYQQGWRFGYTKPNGDVVIFRGDDEPPKPAGRKGK